MVFFCHMIYQIEYIVFIQSIAVLQILWVLVTVHRELNPQNYSAWSKVVDTGIISEK